MKTMDSENGLKRHFVSDHSVHEWPTTTKLKHHTDINTQDLIPFLWRKKRNAHNLNHMSVMKTSQVVADSLNKDDKLDAFDWILNGNEQ